MQRNSKALQVVFWTTIALQLVQATLLLSYIFFTNRLIADVAIYGWGHVPQDRITTFSWLSDNVGPLVTGVGYLSVATYIVLLYQTAALLPRLGVAKHLGTGLTAGSMFIPIYSFYRPWAGLCEVVNTLAAARSRQSIPYAGVRGVTGSVLILAFTVYGYLAIEKGIGIHAEGLGKRAPKTAQETLTFLSSLVNIFMVEVALTAIYVAVIFWFWSRLLNWYRECVDLPNAEIEPMSSGAAPERDILNIGTAPAQ